MHDGEKTAVLATMVVATTVTLWWNVSFHVAVVSAAACVLKSLGLEVPQALQRVREAGSNPQNAEQSGLVDWF